jgi:predicted ATPase
MGEWPAEKIVTPQGRDLQLALRVEQSQEVAMTTAAPERDEGRVDERTKPPFLRRVRIRGYKSIAFCDVALQPLTILVGRNGAGKSNFLDALAFLRDVMDVNLSEAVKRRGGWSSIACRTAKVPGIEFEIEMGGRILPPLVRIPEDRDGQGAWDRMHAVATYQIRLEAHGTSQPTIACEHLVVQGPDREAGFEVVGEGVRVWPSPRPTELLETGRLDRTHLGLFGIQPLHTFGDGLRNMGFYDFRPESMRQLQKQRRGLLEWDGSNLASVIVSLKETDEDAVERIRDYLALINEDVKGFDVATYGEYETIRFDLRVPLSSSPVSFDAASTSDGTLRALAALVAAFQINLPAGPSVVGIEEPETSLHPAAMRALVDAMDEATARTQVLLTTHSAELLSGRDVTPGQVLVVRNRGGMTHITPVDPASREIVEKELYSLADLQRMDRLDLDESDVKRQARLSNGAAGE